MFLLEDQNTISSDKFTILVLPGLHGFFFDIVRWTAGMMREMAYSSVRMGLYEPIKHQLGGTDRHNTPLHIKAAAGALAGKRWSQLQYYAAQICNSFSVRIMLDYETLHLNPRDIEQCVGI